MNCWKKTKCVLPIFMLFSSLFIQAGTFKAFEDEASKVNEEARIFLRSSHRREIKATPIRTPEIFQNPFMAPNNFSEIHNNSYQTDTVSIQGPALFKSTRVDLGEIEPVTGIAGTIAFEEAGRIVSIRTGTSFDSEVFNILMLVNPKTLEVIAETELPPRTSSSAGVSFAGGGYFFLDNQNRVVCVTSTQEIRRYAIVQDEFILEQTYDLSVALNNSDDILNSVLPDAFGNLWFITKEAQVGYVNAAGQIYVVGVRDFPGTNPNETNTKSFASDETGAIYVVTDHALYRFEIGGGNLPTIIWRSAYDRGTRLKPGQNQQGSGTTPTLFNDFAGRKFVTIADNADPYVHVLVFDRTNGNLIAEQTVFEELPFENCCENSLIAVNHSVIIENNYGNFTVSSTLGNRTTSPGLSRIDFNPESGESRLVWENYNISIPSIVTALSTEDGFIYTYGKDERGWFFGAVNYDTGCFAYQKRVDVFDHFSNYLGNNFYGGLNIGPDHTVYTGVFGGIIAWRPVRCRGNAL